MRKYRALTTSAIGILALLSGGIAVAGSYFAALPVLRRLRREPRAGVKPDGRVHGEAAG